MVDAGQDEIPEGATEVGVLHAQCPCGEAVPIPVFAWLIGEPFEQVLRTEGDMTDLWAHSFTHTAGTN